MLDTTVPNEFLFKYRRTWECESIGLLAETDDNINELRGFVILAFLGGIAVLFNLFFPSVAKKLGKSEYGPFLLFLLGATLIVISIFVFKWTISLKNA